MPRPGVLAAIADAEVVVVCPSNPIVSIGPVLAVPGRRRRLGARRRHVVAVSPIIAGAALKGPADRLLAELGHETDGGGRGPPLRRLRRDAAWSTKPTPASADAVEACGVRCVVAPTVMHTPDHAAALASRLLDAGRASGATPSSGR